MSGAGRQQARVAVCDPAGAYRRGLASALVMAGYLVEDVLDPLPAGDAGGLDAVLATVRSASDWDVLGRLAGRGPGVKVIALLVDPTPDRYAEALRRGAHGAVAWDAPPETIVAVLTAALEGMTVFPTAVARAIAVTGTPLLDPGWITEEEIEWLRLLAGGATVLHVAETTGYSERALYRLLHGLYGRMRVSNRTEAIVLATRYGLLDERAAAGAAELAER